MYFWVQQIQFQFKTHFQPSSVHEIYFSVHRIILKTHAMLRLTLANTFQIHQHTLSYN